MAAALVAIGIPAAGHKQSQVVVDLRHGGNGAARVLIAGTLIDANGRLQAFDQVNIGTFELMQELPRVDREAFDVLPLPFGEQGVEGGKARLPTVRK